MSNTQLHKGRCIRFLKSDGLASQRMTQETDAKRPSLFFLTCSTSKSRLVYVYYAYHSEGAYRTCVPNRYHGYDAIHSVQGSHSRSVV